MNNKIVLLSGKVLKLSRKTLE